MLDQQGYLYFSAPSALNARKTKSHNSKTRMSESEVIVPSDRKIKVYEHSGIFNREDAESARVGDVFYNTEQKTFIVIKADKTRHQLSNGVITKSITNHMVDAALQFEPLFTHEEGRKRRFYLFVDPKDKCIARLFGGEALPQWDRVVLCLEDGKFTIRNIMFGNGMTLAGFFTDPETGRVRKYLPVDAVCDMPTIHRLYWKSCTQPLICSAIYEMRWYHSDAQIDAKMPEFCAKISAALLGEGWVFTVRIDTIDRTFMEVVMCGSEKTFNAREAFDKIVKFQHGDELKLYSYATHYTFREVVSSTMCTEIELPLLRVNDYRLRWSSSSWAWRTIEERLSQYAICMFQLALPVYVVLEIIDFLPEFKHTKRFDKVACIEKVYTSARRFREKRAESNKQQKNE